MNLLYFIAGSKKNGGGSSNEPITWTQHSICNEDYFNAVACGSSYCYVGGKEPEEGYGSDTYASDPTGTWTCPSPASANTNFGVVAYGDSYYVRASDNYKLYTSTAPSGTWTQRTYPLGTNIMRTLNYDGSTYWLAGGASGSLYYTSDITGSWTSVSSGTSNTIYGSAYNGSNLWVIVALGGYLATSPDATTAFTSRTSSFGTTDIYEVAYGNGYWVAVGASSKLAYSSDGTTWTQNTNHSFTGSIVGVNYGSGAWVAVGENGEICTASDPTGTWTSRTSGVTYYLRSCCYDSTNDKWVVAGYSGTVLTATPGS